MNIIIEDVLRVENLDVYRMAGGKYRAFVIEIPNIIVTDGNLTITFVSIRQNPMISGIEIFRSKSVESNNNNDTTTAPTTTTPTIAPTVYLETESPYHSPSIPTTPTILPPVPIYTGTNFPTAAPLTLPPYDGQVPSSSNESSIFHNIFINCGGTFFLIMSELIASIVL
jgi:hypothetical protein